MSASRTPWLLAAAGVGFALVGLYVWRKGGIAAAAQGVGGAVVDVVGGVASGAVGAVGQGVGLPPPDKTVREPAVARWIIDNAGQFEASKWASAWAYLRAQAMPSGSGTPPDPASPAGYEFRYLVGASQWVAYTDAENDRLLGLYPVRPPPLSYDQYINDERISGIRPDV